MPDPFQRLTDYVSSSSDGEGRTLPEKFVGNPVVQFLAFAAFLAALVAVVTAGFEPREAGFDRSKIDTVAQYDIRATHDFTYTKPSVSGGGQGDSSISVPPVFDWKTGRTQTYRNEIGRAFRNMRRALADRARQRLSEQAPEELEQLLNDTSATTRTRALIETLPEARRVAIARELRGEEFRGELPAAIPDSNFDVLARHGFPPGAEHALANLVAEVMNEPVVDGDELSRVDTSGGVFLRRMRESDLLVEYQVNDLESQFVPLRDVPSLVRRFAPKRTSGLSEDGLRSAVVSAAIALIQPNTTYNRSKTVEKRSSARRAASERVERHEFTRGDVIVERGSTITERDYQVIRQMQEEVRSLSRVQVVAGTVFLALLLIVTLFLFGLHNIHAFDPDAKAVFFTAVNLLLFLALTQVFRTMSHAMADQLGMGSATLWYYLIPVAAGGMLIRLILNNAHAVVFTILFSFLAGVVVDTSLYFAAYTALGTLVGVATVQQVKRRMALMWSGVTVGAVNAASVLAFLSLRGELFQSVVLSMQATLIGFGGGILSGLIVLALLPVFEFLFGYTTDIKLLELANLDHPLLRRLIVRAPGSYHHSMMVSSLCEAAAESIDANPLLARVGAYYHDIGKTKNPQYFAENQKPNENPHDELKPNLSALIIKNHVKDGLEMARDHGLPKEIQAFIAQHHGTSLISYFYHQAKEMEDPDIPEVDEEDYRYPGPKPQSRETAICLLADGIEAASRAMRNPTPARLKGLVQTMINKAFTDGQLDECDLTLRDLDAIANALTRILTGIFHQRPEYPDDEDERRDRMDQANTAADEEMPEPSQEEIDQLDAARSDSPTARSSETITTAEEQEPAHAGGDSESGDDDGSNGDGSTGDDDSEEGRESLPRLGSG